MESKFEIRHDKRFNIFDVLKLSAIIGLGIFFAYMALWVGFVILIILLPLIYIHDGVIFKKDSYYEYSSVFGLRFGKHQPLPPILYVLVRNVRFIHQGKYRHRKYTRDFYEVALVCGGSKKIVLLHTADSKFVIQTAHKANAYFQCEIYDTTRERLMGTDQ